ncbi:copper resistance D family protein [Marinobacterium sediminicola]|uniref:Copper resistance protein D n=1 Tax=Marinobacterium sediminicola TaxID=518898 RepID=A0ABY1S292_9GAMM|nr:CopD family protein [Marinobacterium sediminicola]ULG68481.1 CopD family protein [Marinobacterium sediminicola]SMR76742.1 putative copper resistance protein D [Marinobacterium sediminicola]
MSGWEWLTLASRWGLYLGMVIAVGGIASEWLLQRYRALVPTLNRYTSLGILVALLALGVHFLSRAGALAEAGIGGMFDPLMLQFIWHSTVGDALLITALGLLLLGGSHLVSIRSAATGILRWIQLGTAIGGMAILAFSYTLSGHVQSEGLIGALTLTVHVLLISWWMGSLYPLWLATHRLDSDSSHAVLEVFGRLALPAVVMVLAAGMLLSYRLTGWSSEVLGSRYGFWLILKVALVAIILLLAAFHKFYLVPALKQAGDARSMKRSLLLEKLVGMAILAVTTVLAVLVGPGH